MTAAIKHRIHKSAAQAVLSEILSKQAKYFYFVGKTLIGGEDSIPTTDADYESQTRSNIVALKNIGVSDVAYVVPRVNWIANRIYGQYDVLAPDTQLDYYVMVADTFNVYKCLDNNSGALSTVQPTGSDISPIITGDGYKWKFLYNIGLSLRNKFLNDEFMPVATSTESRFFSNGAIDSVTINSAGSGYLQGTTTITVDNTNSGGVPCELTPVISAGKLVSVTIVNPGSGYTSANATVSSTTPGATGASITLNLSKGDLLSTQAAVETLSSVGTIESISIVDQGSGYSGTSANVTIVGDGIGATATATISGGFVTKVTMTNVGSGYTRATATVDGLSGSAATIYPNYSPTYGHGRNVVNELGARRLMFFGTLTNQKIAGFDMNNDYRQFGIIKNPTTLAGSTRISNPVNANMYQVRGVVDIDPTKWVVGSAITVAGQAATVSAVVLNADGPSSLIVKSTLVEVVAGMLVAGGTGGASFTVATDVVNVGNIDATTATGCYTVTTATYDKSLYDVDSILTEGSLTYVIVANNATSFLALPLNGGTISIGDTLTKAGVGSLTVTAVTQPTFDRQSGDLLYIDNRASFFQTVDQTISFRTVIKF